MMKELKKCTVNICCGICLKQGRFDHLQKENTFFKEEREYGHKIKNPVD